MLAAIGVTPSKGWGQSFLTDPFVADAEAALVGPRSSRGVVEVGGGLGILTAALLRRGIRPLTVVEKDPRLANFLRSMFDRRITVVEGDALEVPIPPVDAIVGNLPFSVATLLLLRFLPMRIPRVVVLLQKEVAERLAAGPGSRTFGRLSILARLYGDVELFQPVPSTSFSPVPGVEGQIVLLTARPGPLPVTSVERTESVVRQLFRSRRKQLGNLLPSVTPAGEGPDDVARAADWPEGWRKLRPEELAPEAYFRLANELERRPRGSGARQV
ncbi:MAG: 16S rRNA (adenine(1518)-N(6)/adenine(1519)-N(6))-dimethyltransferase RsmA [Thermoplasmata archaeon]|nr:16S rRNA (adenine(1518)-N(6)/adenine(1519)-N(6))-dimethyltransferase RsmA [Thermoplasmata archaeon]